jgi:hypothetical protein
MQAGGPMPTVVDQNIAAMTPAPAPVMTGSGGTLQTGYGGPVTTGMASGGLPEDQGIAQIPTPNMQRMADGGIAGYEDDEEGMATGGMGGMFNFAQQSEPVVRMAEGGILNFSNGGTKKLSGSELFDRALDMEGITNPRERAFLKALHAQESSGKATEKTSNRDAHGAMQILPATFKSVADPSMDINKPLDNMRAGIRYGMQGFTAAKGDPVLAGAYYYGGPSGMQKAAKGQAVSDPKNPKAPTTIDYGNSIAKRMTAMLPIGSAVAETPPKAGITDLVSQIPGSKVAPPAPGQKDRYITGNQGVIGAGETALQYLTGTLAIPTAGGAAALEQVPNMLSGIFGSGKGIDRAELEKSFRDKAAQVTYEPRTVGGRTVSESTAKTLEDLKVPSYLARIGSGASVRRPSAGAADVKALAKEAAATAAEKTKTADTLRLPPPSEQGIAGLAKGAETILVDSQGNALPPKTPPAVPPVKGAARAAQEGERVATGDRLLNLAKDKAEAAEARKAAESWAKAEEATTKADAQNLLADERFGQTNRAQGLATLTGATPAAISESNAATTAANAAAGSIPFKGIDDAELQRMQEANQAPMTRDDIVEAAKEATPAKERKGFNNDDLLTLGLNLLASKSPNFMTALGEAGLATVAGKKEREKLAREQTMIDTELGYKKAKTKEAEASAALIERGGKEKNLELQAEQMIYDNLGKWEKTTAGQMALMNDPTAKAREESRLRTAIYASLGLKNIMPSTSASSGVGLSASDSALINKYLR